MARKTPTEPKPEEALKPVAPAEEAPVEGADLSNVSPEVAKALEEAMTPPQPASVADHQEDNPQGSVDAEADAEPDDSEAGLLFPIVGEIVHYRLPSGQVRPAIVIHAHDEETVDLQVLTRGQEDRPVIPERVVTINVNTGADVHAVPSMVFRSNVTLGDEPGQWSYLG